MEEVCCQSVVVVRFVAPCDQVKQMGGFSVMFHCERWVLREFYRSGITLETNDYIFPVVP